MAARVDDDNRKHLSTNGLTNVNLYKMLYHILVVRNTAMNNLHTKQFIISFH